MAVASASLSTSMDSMLLGLIMLSAFGVWPSIPDPNPGAETVVLNGIPSTIYNGASDKLGLLQTVLSIFESLQNNIDLYRSIETEFTTTSSAYENIKTRIDELHKQIAKLPSYQPTTKSITYLFHN